MLSALDQLIQGREKKHLQDDPQGNHQHQDNGNQGDHAELNELALPLPEHAGIQGDFKVADHGLTMHDGSLLSGCLNMVVAMLFKKDGSLVVRYFQRLYQFIFEK